MNYLTIKEICKNSGIKDAKIRNFIKRYRHIVPHVRIDEPPYNIGKNRRIKVTLIDSLFIEKMIKEGKHMINDSLMIKYYEEFKCVDNYPLRNDFEKDKNDYSAEYFCKKYSISEATFGKDWRMIKRFVKYQVKGTGGKIFFDEEVAEKLIAFRTLIKSGLTRRKAIDIMFYSGIDKKTNSDKNQENDNNVTYSSLKDSPKFEIGDKVYLKSSIISSIKDGSPIYRSSEILGIRLEKEDDKKIIITYKIFKAHNGYVGEKDILRADDIEEILFKYLEIKNKILAMISWFLPEIVLNCN